MQLKARAAAADCVLQPVLSCSINAHLLFWQVAPKQEGRQEDEKQLCKQAARGNNFVATLVGALGLYC
jgi:hypothetical protein